MSLEAFVAADSLAFVRAGDEFLAAEIMPDTEFHHAFKSKRYTSRGRFYLLDGAGTRAEVEVAGALTSGVENVGKIPEGLVRLRVVDKVQFPKPHGGATRAVLLPLLKGDSLTQAFSAAVLLGATDIIPWMSERTIVKWKDSKKELKEMEKLKALAISESKVARRAYFPEVHPLVSKMGELKRLLVEFESTVVLHESASDSLREHVRKLKSADSLLLVIGPEGGLTDSELELFKAEASESSGVFLLGENVLRAPLALAAGLSLLML